MPKASAILRTVFREADVLGRIGGDEFAVAGEFTEPGMIQAIRRLEGVVADWNVAHDREIAISLSFGAATSAVGTKNTLDQLLADADRAMYENKRRKKSMAQEAKLLRMQG
jgi:diguanylate cyclase (GGDEF)-like protein